MNWLNDLRVSWRGLRKTPQAACVAIVALALGIGANTAVFSVASGILLRPLPFYEPERLVMLWGNVQRTAGVERRGASIPDFEDWRTRSKSFESMAAAWSSDLTLYSNAAPERIRAEVVSASYFDLLGIKAVTGRTFQSEDETAHVAVLSEELWKSRFGSDPRTLGQSIRLDNRAYTIIGVAPAWFKGMSDGAVIWVPMRGSFDPGDRQLQERGSRWFAALARLKPGVTRESAQLEMTQLSRQLELAYPATNEKRSVEVARLSSELFGDLGQGMILLLSSVGLLFLISCANVAHVQLARAEARRQELAVRIALGAERRHLIRHAIAEGLSLALAGGVAGVLIAVWSADAIVKLSPVVVPGFAQATLDWRVAAFAFSISVLAGLATALALAFTATSRPASMTLSDSSARTAGSRNQRLRSALVIAEVALSLVLMAGAGLFMRSAKGLESVPLGFNPERLMAFRAVFPTLAQEPQGNAAAASRVLLDALRSIPRVEAAALASDVPLAFESNAIFYSPEWFSAVDAKTIPRAYVHRVSPDYFQTLGIRLLAGRVFTEYDAAGGVAIINATAARRNWPNENPVGMRFRAGRATTNNPWIQIVGVVEDVKHRGIPDNPTADADLYFPFNERARNFAVLIRTAEHAGGIAGALRQRISAAEPEATIYQVRRMDQVIAPHTAIPRFITWLLSIFAALAMLLASIGVYGMMLNSVVRRTRELGVRIALGATPARIMRAVLGGAATLAVAGIGAGLVLTLILGKTIQARLYGVAANDAWTLSGAAVLMLMVALIAAWIPARRALRVDPVVALRYE